MSFFLSLWYCTVLVNGENHRIIDILEGRDADTLKAWLKENRQVRRFTRDRASNYAKAISEILPDAMQIADRFHLHQNLLDCIKSILNSELPARIKIPKETAEPEQEISSQQETGSKKNQAQCKPRESERNRRAVYQSIRDMLDAHYSYRQIAKTLKVSRKTVAKVSCGNIENLCQSSYQSIWDPFSDEIMEGIQASKTGKEIYIELENRHRTIGKRTSFYKYIAQLADDSGLKLERYRHSPTPLPDGTIPQKDFDYIKRNRRPKNWTIWILALIQDSSFMSGKASAKQYMLKGSVPTKR